jgi:hypothetical protein
VFGPGDRIAPMDMTTPGGTATAPAARPAAARRVGVPSLLEEALVLVVAAVVVTASALLLAPLWAALSPRVELVMTNAGAMYDPETEVFAAADGWFIVLGAIAGAVAAVLCWVLLRRYRGPLMLLAVVVGGGGAALLTWQLGVHIGQSDYEYLLAHAAPGWRFGGPLRLNAKGALPVQALASALVYTVVAGCSRYATLHRDRWSRRDRRADWPVPADGGPASGFAPPPQPEGSAASAPASFAFTPPGTASVPAPAEPAAPPPADTAPAPSGFAPPARPAAPPEPPAPAGFAPRPEQPQRAAAPAPPAPASPAAGPSLFEPAPVPPPAPNHAPVPDAPAGYSPSASSPIPPWMQDQQRPAPPPPAAEEKQPAPRPGRTDDSPTVELPTLSTPAAPAAPPYPAEPAAPPPEFWPKAPGRQPD